MIRGVVFACAVAGLDLRPGAVQAAPARGGDPAVVEDHGPDAGDRQAPDGHGETPEHVTATDDDDADARVIVVPTRAPDASATRVRVEEARRVPGSSGDVVRVIENLPGVGRPTAGSGQLVIWGAPPQDTRIYVDGVPVPRLYHEGGLRSVVQPSWVRTIDLVAGGQGAPWGRGLAGMVAVQTATPERDRVGGHVGADLLDAQASLSSPLDRRRRWHLAVGVRASYVASWAKQVIDADTAGLVPLPSYGDGQARLLWRPSSRNSLEIVAMGSADRVRRGVPDRDPALAIDDRRTTDFGRLYARWLHSPREDVRVSVTPYVGVGRGGRSTTVGGVTTATSSQDLLVGVRANSAWRPRAWLQLDVGVDAELDSTQLRRVGSLGLPAREGDIRVFGQPPPDDLAADRWRVTRVGIAPYVQAELSPWRGRLRIIPGVRLDPYVRAVDRRTPRQAATPKVGVARQDFAIEPRLAIVARVLDRLELHGAAGLYRQVPTPGDLSAAFGNPELPTAKAVHTVVGLRSPLTRSLSIDVTGFYTHSRALAMRNAAAAPPPASALVPSGTGRTVGAQVLLRQELSANVFGWIAYTAMRAQRRDRSATPWRLSDYDQTHVLTGLLAWSLPRGFELAARMRFATGFPRTPVVGAWYDAGRNRYQPEFGAHNSIRVPVFAQLDARLAKRFAIRRSALELFVEVLNVWNRRNAEELVYAADYSRRGVISGFPVLPAAGMQWDF